MPQTDEVVLIHISITAQEENTVQVDRPVHTGDKVGVQICDTVQGEVQAKLEDSVLKEASVQAENSAKNGSMIT